MFGLIANIGGDSNDFKKACQSALKDGEGLIKKLSGQSIKLPSIAGGFGGVSAGTMASSGIAAGAAIAIGVVAKATDDYLTKFKEMRSVSRTLNIPIQQFAPMAEAAKLAGVSVESLGTAMKRMERDLGSSKEKDTYALSLATIGVRLEDVKKKNPSEAFKEIARALADVKDPMEQSSLAMELFGKSGNELLPMLKDGKEGFDELTSAVERYGLGMSAESMKAAEAMMRDQKKMQLEIEATNRKLAEQVGIPWKSNASATVDQLVNNQPKNISGAYSSSASTGLGLRFTDWFGSKISGKGDAGLLTNSLTESEMKVLTEYKKLAESRNGGVGRQSAEAELIAAKAKAKIDLEAAIAKKKEDEIEQKFLKHLKEEASIKGNPNFSKRDQVEFEAREKTKSLEKDNPGTQDEAARLALKIFDTAAQNKSNDLLRERNEDLKEMAHEEELVVQQKYRQLFIDKEMSKELRKNPNMKPEEKKNQEESLGKIFDMKQTSSYNNEIKSMNERIKLQKLLNHGKEEESRIVEAYQKAIDNHMTKEQATAIAKKENELYRASNKGNKIEANNEVSSYVQKGWMIGQSGYSKYESGNDVSQKQLDVLSVIAKNTDQSNPSNQNNSTE